MDVLKQGVNHKGEKWIAPFYLLLSPSQIYYFYIFTLFSFNICSSHWGFSIPPTKMVNFILMWSFVHKRCANSLTRSLCFYWVIYRCITLSRDKRDYVLSDITLVKKRLKNYLVICRKWNTAIGLNLASIFSALILVTKRFKFCMFIFKKHNPTIGWTWPMLWMILLWSQRF